MVLPNVAPGQCHDEDVAEGADSLSRVGPGQIVVAIPSRLLGGVGNELENPRRACSHFAAGAHNLRNYLVTTHSCSPAPAQPGCQPKDMSVLENP